MSPSSPSRRPPSTATLVFTGLAGVGIGVLIFLVVLSLTDTRSTEQAAEAKFRVGSAERLAPDVARDGPLLFQDPLNRSRDIYVQHLGGDDWRAFDARSPGAARRCVLTWRNDDRTFVDPCDGRTYPADGTGLVSYPTEIDDDGRVVVDLNAPAPVTTPPTTTPPAPDPY